MAPNRETVLRALDKANVRYLIVGGVAVVLHGILRTTLDLDLVVQLERANIDRALSAIKTLGFEPRAPVPLASFADLEQREAWAREKNMQVFSLWHPQSHMFTIDLFLREPFDFEAAYARRVQLDLGGFEASVLGIDELIRMKEQAGRAQDIDDLQRLRELLEEES